MPGLMLSPLSTFPTSTVTLNLDHQPCFLLKGLTSELTKLHTLSINYSAVEGFQGIPFLPNLMHLSAHHNRISGNLHDLCRNCPRLQKLNLAFNRLTDLTELKPLSQLEELEELDLCSNEVARPLYVNEIFSMIPSLQLLHAYNVMGINVATYKRDEILSNISSDSESSDDDSVNLIQMQEFNEDVEEMGEY